jgi:hypothetical protein
MKKLISLFIVPAIVIASGCNHDKKHPRKKQKHIKSKDTLFVTRRSAISVWLDMVTLEKRRKQYGDTDFYTVADDEAYYSSTADSVLRAQKLPLIDTRQYGACKFIKFEQKNGTATVVRIDTLPKLHTLYLFDPSKAPYEADVAAMDQEYKAFYH